jgi:hypothetical protein
MYALGAVSEGSRRLEDVALNYPGSVMQCDSLGDRLGIAMLFS